MGKGAARLCSARMIGAAAVGLFGYFALGTADGRVGGVDVPPGPSWLAVAWMGAGTVLAVWAHLSGKSWAGVSSGLVLAGAAGAFIPAVGRDPVVAGAVVAWLLLSLSRVLFPPPASPLRRGTTAGEGWLAPHHRWLATNRKAAQHLLLVSLALTIGAVGFHVGDNPPVLAVCAAAGMVAVVCAIPYLSLLVSAGSKLPWLLVAPLLGMLASVPRPEAVLAWAGVLQTGVLATLLARSEVTEELLESFFRRPALLVTASFFALIVTGTVALSFPAAVAPGHWMSPIDALFTSTSAACVTGLVVVDTASAFSGFGHAVILLLIQIGGLNIMVLSAFAALLLGESLGLRGEQALGEVLNLPVARTAPQLAAFIVVATLAIEAVGAALLFFPFAARGETLAEALWQSVFHSVSAFCNAGFALQPDSLISFQRDPYAITVVAVLIVLGGLGFNVLGTVWARACRRHGVLSVQFKVVVTVSVALTVIGAAWFALAEWHRSLAGLHPTHKMVNAAFHSVTARTAGFTTVDLTLLHPATIILLMVLMFVGASPGGTGGGIKTTTAAVLLGAVAAVARGQSRIVLFGRTIPMETVSRAVAITVLAALVAATGTAALLATGALPLEKALFEVFSALGTVGLSLGTTAQLTTAGKLIVVVVMFIGRVGPLSLALLLARTARGRVTFPEARLMVG